MDRRVQDQKSSGRITGPGSSLMDKVKAKASTPKSGSTMNNMKSKASAPAKSGPSQMSMEQARANRTARGKQKSAEIGGKSYGSTGSRNAETAKLDDYITQVAKSTGSKYVTDAGGSGSSTSNTTRSAGSKSVQNFQRQPRKSTNFGAAPSRTAKSSPNRTVKSSSSVSQSSSARPQSKMARKMSSSTSSNPSKSNNVRTGSAESPKSLVRNQKNKSSSAGKAQEAKGKSIQGSIVKRNAQRREALSHARTQNVPKVQEMRKKFANAGPNDSIRETDRRAKEDPLAYQIANAPVNPTDFLPGVTRRGGKLLVGATRVAEGLADGVAKGAAKMTTRKVPKGVAKAEAEYAAKQSVKQSEKNVAKSVREAPRIKKYHGKTGKELAKEAPKSAPKPKAKGRTPAPKNQPAQRRSVTKVMGDPPKKTTVQGTIPRRSPKKK